MVKQAKDESNVGGNEHLDNGENASDDRSNELVKNLIGEDKKGNQKLTPRRVQSKEITSATKKPTRTVASALI